MILTTFVLKMAQARARFAAIERGGNNLIGVEDFRAKNGSSQDRNLAVTASCVPDRSGADPERNCQIEA